MEVADKNGRIRTHRTNPVPCKQIGAHAAAVVVGGHPHIRNDASARSNLSATCAIS